MATSHKLHAPLGAGRPKKTSLGLQTGVPHPAEAHLKLLEPIPTVEPILPLAQSLGVAKSEAPCT